MALAASAWVTTEQELKFAVETDPVVVDPEGIAVEPTDAVVAGPTGAVVVGAVDDFDEEPHAARPTIAALATTPPTTLHRSLIEPLDQEGARMPT